MPEPTTLEPGWLARQEYVDAKIRLQLLLYEFARLFDYEEPNDRAIAIIGLTFLDTLITDLLTNFLVDDADEVERLLRPDGALGTFGAKVSLCYCLGLIAEIIKDDLRLVAKIRNRFAHEMLVDFEDEKINAWCRALKWHRTSLMRDPPSDASARDLFQVGVNQLVVHLNALPGLAAQDRRQRAAGN